MSEQFAGRDLAWLERRRAELFGLMSQVGDLICPVAGIRDSLWIPDGAGAYQGIRATTEQPSVGIGLDQYGRGCLGHDRRGCGHRRQRYRCPGRRDVVAAARVRQGVPTRFVVPAGSGLGPVVWRAFSVPGFVLIVVMSSPAAEGRPLCAR
jgi:hypothetical protein